jgi:UDP:flavonoid glycosyltransferase YjiC (YdhE family)
MYLRSTMRIEPLLKQAAAMPVRILAVVPEMQQGVTGRTPPNLRLSKDPAKLRNIVATADLAVCNSATGTGAAFLMGGVPLLVIPTSIEQIMVALRVQDQGMGLAVADGPNANYQVAIQRLLREPGFREAARAFAKKYSGFQSSNAAAICDRLELALERPRELAAVAP